MIYRFLTPGEIRPHFSALLLDARPERQYAGQDSQPDLLAQAAADRQPGQSLIVNFYRIYTDHMTSDVMASLDVSELDEHTRQQLTLSLWYRSMYGYGVLMMVDGRLFAPTPRGYWPLMDKGVRIGSVIVSPYNTKGQNLGLHASQPNRALVVEHIDGQQSPLYDTQMSGVTLGASFARAGVVDGLAVMGGEQSAFVPMEPIVEQLDSVLRSAARVARRQGSPHLQVPAASVQYNDAGEPTLVLYEGGNIFPTARDDKDVKYVTLDATTTMFEFAYKTSLDALAAVCQLPRTTFGELPLPRLDSASGINELNTASNEKAEVWLNDLIRAGQEIGVSLSRVEQEETTDGSSNDSGADRGPGGPTASA